MLPLETDDLDFANHNVKVSRSLSLGKLKSTKTSASRDVDMSVQLENVLERHLASLRKQNRKKGRLDASSGTEASS